MKSRYRPIGVAAVLGIVLLASAVYWMTRQRGRNNREQARTEFTAEELLQLLASNEMSSPRPWVIDASMDITSEELAGFCVVRAWLIPSPGPNQLGNRELICILTTERELRLVEIGFLREIEGALLADLDADGTPEVIVEIVAADAWSGLRIQELDDPPVVCLEILSEDLGFFRAGPDDRREFAVSFRIPGVGRLAMSFDRDAAQFRVTEGASLLGDGLKCRGTWFPK